MCLKCPPPAHTWSQMVAPLDSRSLSNVLFKVKPSLHQAFLEVVDITNLCFVHALLHNTPNFIICSPFWWSYAIHSMQFSLVISHRNVIFCSVIFFSVLTFTRYCSNSNYVRWVKFIPTHVSFIVESNRENCIKIIIFWHSYRQK